MERRRKYSARKSGNEIPLGWTHVDPPHRVQDGDRHSWYRCPEVQFAFTTTGMELRRCSHVCRKDQIKRHVSSKAHVFAISQRADSGFPQRAIDNQRIQTLEKLRGLVLESTAQAVIKLGISLNKATEQTLWNFCVEMIRIGQTVALERVDVDEAMISFSRSVLTDKVLEIGARLKLRDTEVARETNFVNIAVDAGTVLGKSVVHSVLTNPYSDRFPILLEIVDNDGFDKFKYEQLFAYLSLHCKQAHLTVCSIVTDGLRAQRSALEELIRESEDSYVRAIVPLHCLAHVTQLVFTDTVKYSSVMRSKIQETHELATLLRTSKVVRELGEKCPSVCPTRWLYIVDVLVWLYAREEKLTAFLLASENNETQWEQLPREWKQLLILLLPLKRLSLCMESSACALWEVIPIIEGVLNAWKKVMHLLSEEYLHVLRMMVTNLIVRFSAVAPQTINASFALSELGRDVLRQREEGLQTRGPSQACFTTDRITSVNALFDDPEKDLRTNLDLLPEAEEEEVDAEASDAPSDGHDHDHGFFSGDLHQDTEDICATQLTREEIMELSFDNLLTWDIYRFSYSSACEELVRMGGILGVDQDYMREKMAVWLFAPREETPTYHDIGHSPDTIWRRAPANCEHWRPFAEVALRFTTISTSEADCERMLSRQKDIQGIRTSNIRTQLLDARLRR